MSEPIRLTILIISLVIIGGAVVALLLFMLVFPLWNHLFGTHLPTFRYGELEEEEAPAPKSRVAKKTAPNHSKPKARAAVRPAQKLAGNAANKTKKKDEEASKRASAKSAEMPKNTSAKSTGKKTTLARIPAKTIRVPEKNTSKSALKLPPKSIREREPKKAEASAPAVRTPRPPDFHKDIPTVRVDTLFAPAQTERPLTAAKIDAEGRRATKTEGVIKQAVKQESETPAKRPLVRKKRDAGEPETVEIQ